VKPVTLVDAAATGLDDTVTALLHVSPTPGWDEIDVAFWSACRYGHRGCAEILLRHGAELNRCQPSYDGTPLDAAVEGGADDIARWLRTLGGAPARNLRPPEPTYARRTR
jgi:uncharacterized protein